ncbi:MAG TPA: sugar ABC transporter permease [Chloroflexota bacterium]|nr:sugar ABC transporter permease [Chloroflexota bacterium]
MGGKAYARRGKYIMFILPATIITVAVILFPWVFTLWMSLNDWTIGSSQSFVGLDNFTKLATDQRFLDSIPRTMYYTALAVVLPVIFGTLAAVVFNQHFPLRGLLRGIFIMPMMATPVAVALVWTMMFHPQLGVLNYILSLVGIPPQMWVYAQDTVIPALVLVETWNWTPLIMVIMLGGLAVLPTEPYESAVIDGANAWNIFWHITFPLVLPFMMVAVILRTIDALKAFDTIFVITQGGPGTASETINILLYLQAFAYYKIGSASAIVVVFFAIIVALSLVMLYMRQKTLWTE